LLHPDRHVGR